MIGLSDIETCQSHYLHGMSLFLFQSHYQNFNPTLCQPIPLFLVYIYYPTITLLVYTPISSTSTSKTKQENRAHIPLDQNQLIMHHPSKILPPMTRIKLDTQRLTVPIWVHQRHRHHVLLQIDAPIIA